MNLHIGSRVTAAVILAATLLLTNICDYGADAPKRRADRAADGQLIPYKTVPYDKASPETMKWWEDAKFGLFVHWGPYSVPGGIWSKDGTFKTRFEGSPDALVEVKGYAEQILKGTHMPLGEYEKIAGVFDWSKFNAQDYINLCFASGQHYIVITSKHHDGFAMWRSNASTWNIGDATPYGRQSGRDPLKELADACHATKTNGSPWEIKLCFYHSHCADWWEEDGVAFVLVDAPIAQTDPLDARRIADFRGDAQRLGRDDGGRGPMDNHGQVGSDGTAWKRVSWGCTRDCLGA